MSVLFIGGVFAKENQEEIIENTKGYAEFSANIFQQKLINGLKKNGTDITVLSAPLVSSYPNRYKKMYFKGFREEQNEYRYVKFNNLWGYKNFSRAYSLKKEIKKMVCKEKKVYDIILVYCAHQPFLEAATYAKKLMSGAKICFVVPDLPQYMNLDTNKTKIYDILKKIDIDRMKKHISAVDSFVVLTEQMKDVLEVGERPCIVAEGIIDAFPEKAAVSDKDTGIKSIVYAGKLNKAFGIPDLVDAFMSIPGENYRLILCGNGDAKDFVTEKSRLDSRIDYRGQVPPEVAAEIIKNADVLVNPRPDEGEYTKYSFPSKNIEYLVSGKPVVCFMLSGMPREYADFVYPINGKNGFAEALTSALENDNSKKYSAFYEYAKKKLMSESIAEAITNL